MSSENAPESASPAIPSQPVPKKRRKWIRRVLWAGVLGLLLLLLGLLVLTGPAFPAAARLAGLKAAAMQGLEGDFEIEGSLWSGFSITGLTLGGTENSGSPLTQITIEEASVDYNVKELLTATSELDWLRLVKIHDVTLELELPDADESPEETDAKEKERQASKRSNTYSPLWNLLQTDFDLAGLNLVISQGERSWRVDDLNLRSVPGEDVDIRIAGLTFPQSDPSIPLAATLTPGERTLEIHSVEIGEHQHLEFLRLSEPEPGIWEAESRFEFAGGVFSVHAETPGSVTVSMQRGSTLDLSLLPHSTDTEMKPGEPLAGSITDLNLEFHGEIGDPATWDVRGSLVGSALRWQNIEIDTAAILVRDRRASIELSTPHAHFNGSVAAHLDRMEPLDTETAWSTLPLTVNATLSIPSLGPFFQNLIPDQDIPVSGSLTARLQELQVSGGTRLRSGSALLETTDASWDGTPLRSLQIAAQALSSGEVELVALGDLDDKTALRIEGRLEPETLAYEAQGELKLNTEGNFASAIRSAVTSASPPLEAAGTATWKGSGNILSREHSGDSEVLLTGVRWNGATPFDLSATATYTESETHLPRLRLESDDLAISGSARWEGASSRIALSDWKVHQNDVETLSLHAAIPGDLFSKPRPQSQNEASPSAPADEPLAAVETLELDLDIRALELADILRLFQPEPALHGSLSGQLRAAGSARDLQAEGNLAFHSGETGPVENASLSLDIGLGGDLYRPDSWEAEVKALLSGLRWKELDLEEISLEVRTLAAGGSRFLTVDLDGNQSGAALAAQARMDLTDCSSLSSLAEPNMDLSVDLTIPDLAPVWHDFAPQEWQTIPLSGELAFQVQNGRISGKKLTSGQAFLRSETLQVEGEVFEKIELTATVREENLVSAGLIIHADERSRIEGSGSVHLTSKDVEGQLALALDLKNEGVLRGLLGNREIARLLPRMTELKLTTTANLESGALQGSFSLDAADLSLADGADPIRTLKAAAEFTESRLDGSLDLKSDPLDLLATVDWNENRFTVSRLEGTSGGAPLFDGDLSFPLDPEKLTPAEWFAQEEPISMQMTSQSLPLGTIFRLVQNEAPVDGQLTLEIEAKGSPSRPDMNATLQLSQLTLPEQDNLSLGEVELRLLANEGEAELDGAFRHPHLNPLEIKANAPFLPREWALGERDFLEESLAASAKMEPGSLDFLASQVPAIQSTTGTVGLDLAVVGTIREPLVSGDGILEVSRLRLKDRDAPSFYDIDLKTRFAENRFVVEHLRAIIAGGRVEASGSVTFQAGAEPEIDMQVGGKEVLIYRNPDLSLRTDADLALRGPWTSAALTGEIGITSSRHFKNFDLIPNAFPTRNTSALPTVDRGPRGRAPAPADLDFGVEIPPFQDWTVDVRVFTKEPFLVRSNLAESDLVADLSLHGTLGRPIPRGYVAIDEGNLSLPFSSIDVEIGRIEFDEATGFNGAIELKARAKADKYNINIFLHNRILDPKYVLTSVPPLPTEDLITLIIAGTTRSEMIGAEAGSVAASRAATLLLKNFTGGRVAADREPTLFDQLQERTELDIGGINPETGAESVGGKIRLWKQLFFVGDVDAASDYRAVLKYVFRFR